MQPPVVLYFASKLVLPMARSCALQLALAEWLDGVEANAEAWSDKQAVAVRTNSSFLIGKNLHLDGRAVAEALSATPSTQRRSSTDVRRVFRA
jgi:hypothetical protein